MKYIKIRRSGTDRRKSTVIPTFPLLLANGTIVAQDRRRTCDRRMEGIRTSLSTISNEEFTEYFGEYRKKVEL